jgi:hypothetical protein
MCVLLQLTKQEDEIQSAWHIFRWGLRNAELKVNDHGDECVGYRRASFLRQVYDKFYLLVGLKATNIYIYNIYIYVYIDR